MKADAGVGAVEVKEERPSEKRGGKRTTRKAIATNLEPKTERRPM